MITCASLILGLHLVSYHHDQRSFTNNTNPGVYVECDGWTAGVYKNTLSRPTVYGGYTWRSGPFALTVGLASGYQKEYGQRLCEPGVVDLPENRCFRGVADSPVMPIVVPSVSVGPARVWFVPKIKSSSAAVHLSIERAF